MAKRTSGVAVVLGVALAGVVAVSILGFWLGIKSVRLVPSRNRPNGAFLGYACGYSTSGKGLGWSGHSYKLGRFEVEVWRRDY